MIEHLASARFTSAREQLLAGEAIADMEAELIELLELPYDEHEREVAASIISLFTTPILALAIHEGVLSEPLHKASMAMFERLLPAMGVQPVGTLSSLIKDASRAFMLEDRKVTLILERLEHADPESLEKMLIGYLSTRPAPIFARALEARVLEEYAAAKASWEKQLAMDLPAREQLLAAARSNPPFQDPERIACLLHDTLAALPRPEQLIRAVLDDTRAEHDARLLTSMLAGWMNETFFVEKILAIVLEPPKHDVEVFASIAANLEEAMAMQVLALALAEITWGNPEEPENQWTPEKARATLTARTLLPEIGSPLEAVELDAFEASADPELRDLPRRTRSLYERWKLVIAYRGVLDEEEEE